MNVGPGTDLAPIGTDLAPIKGVSRLGGALYGVAVLHGTHAGELTACLAAGVAVNTSDAEGRRALYLAAREACAPVALKRVSGGGTPKGRIGVAVALTRHAQCWHETRTHRRR